ncbi:hypothetical protein Dimus_019589 [Dionaea muscipula]
MSDEGEKMCPLCAEEMDLTDQQLKPCKCGYEICVWCWHHIMDMAEKDETEGRCPACRTPYDKERIVGMTAKCERLVAEVSLERKKSQKAKSKTSEGRKQLSSVRVIQRNLVYIVGLPLNLADEDLLQRKEYFGQYGKVLKVSISRTSSGTIQQFPNNTCSIYITYSKEEEAVRCIQSVHGFMLEGRPLRACFGTTKYCHAWLRNVPCNNPDCLYLHEIGSNEDSFTKDEIISAYTRSRVQQITGVANNMQRRSGNVLPPPTDDYCSNGCASSAKPVIKNAANSSVTSTRASTPPSSTSRSGALPPAASWGTRALNGQSSGGSTLYEPSKHKPEAAAGSVAYTTAVVSSTQASSLSGDVGKKLLSAEEIVLTQPTSKLEPIEHLKRHDWETPRKDVSRFSVTPLGPTSIVSARCEPNTALGTEDMCMESSVPADVGGHSNVSSLERERYVLIDGKDQKLSMELPSIGVDKRSNRDNSKFLQPSGLCLDNLLTGGPGSYHRDPEKFHEPLASPAVNVVPSFDSMNASSGSHDWRSDVISPSVRERSSEAPDIPDNHMSIEASASRLTTTSSSHSIHLIDHLFRSQLQHANSNDAVSPAVHKNLNTSSFGNASSTSVLSSGYRENFISSTSKIDDRLPNGRGSQVVRFGGEVATADSNPMLDIESSIISNILSLDLDGLDESLTSPQNVAQLLGAPDKPHGAHRVSSSWKVQNSNQSRFSFARQDESRNQLFDAVSLFSNPGEGSMSNSFSQAFAENREPYVHSLGNGFGLYQRGTTHSDNVLSIHSGVSPISRAHTSAPPGFSVPSRLPPPGFSSHERNDLIMDVKSGNLSHDASSLPRNAYHTSPGGHFNGHGDIEFMDPAILEVGKGRLSSGGMNNVGLDMRSIFPLQQSTAFENDVKLQSLMQSSLTPRQNTRYSDIRGNDFTAPNDAYTFVSRHVEQSPASSIPPVSQLSLHQPRDSIVSNGHWDAWSELQAGNERLGLDKLHDGYGDPRFQMRNSANLYNRRTFRM